MNNSDYIKYERNVEIYNEYKKGILSMEQIGFKYNISRQQVSIIINRIKKFENCIGFEIVLKLSNGNTNQMSRLYNGLEEFFGNTEYSAYDVIQVDVWEYSKKSTVGVATVELLIELQKELKRL